MQPSFAQDEFWSGIWQYMTAVMNLCKSRLNQTLNRRQISQQHFSLSGQSSEHMEHANEVKVLMICVD